MIRGWRGIYSPEYRRDGVHPQADRPAPPHPSCNPFPVSNPEPAAHRLAFSRSTAGRHGVKKWPARVGSARREGRCRVCGLTACCSTRLLDVAPKPRNSWHLLPKLRCCSEACRRAVQGVGRGPPRPGRILDRTSPFAPAPPHPSAPRPAPPRLSHRITAASSAAVPCRWLTVPAQPRGRGGPN